MVSQDLMPAYRHGAKRRRKRLRRWIAMCAAYAVALAGAYGVAESVWGSDGRALAEESERTGQKIDNTVQEIGELQKKLFEVQRLQAANRVLSDQPDWCLLLALLSETLGEDIVLKSCVLKPAGQARPPAGRLLAPTAHPNGAFVLGLRGFGRSQAAVARFVLRLEKTGLFQEVTTVKISRESFLGGEAVAFHLKCRLLNRAEAES